MQEPHAKVWAGYPPKLLLLGLLLTLEKVPLLYLPPSWLIAEKHWLGGVPVLFGFALLFFSRGKRSLAALQDFPVSVPFLSLHAVLVVALVVVQRVFAVSNFAVGSTLFRQVASLWTALIFAAVLSLILVFIPVRRLGLVLRGLGSAWIYASVCTVAILWLRHLGDMTWNVSSSSFGQSLLQACFQQTHTLLNLFYPVVLARPELHLLGTPGFVVTVSWLCSGIEGLALVAILIVGWLIFTRRELRLERAVLIAPVALAFTWCLNIVRLAVLIAIGSAGHPDVASNGFHAQAGWITLNIVALCFLLLVQNVAWFRRIPAMEKARNQPVPSNSVEVAPADSHSATLPSPNAATQNMALVYLLPFAAVSAAALVSQATSAGFEWLYPLRFFVALAALWLFRRHYRAIDWSFGWMGPLAGLAVAAMWIGLRLGTAQTATGDFSTAMALDNLPAVKRIGWIAIRVLASVVTVPIVEELAFRGFLARRVLQAEFEKVPYSRLNLLSLLISSVAFGAMHGRMWAAGAVAGLLFGLVAKLRNRLGEAVAAHAVANLAIAVLAVIRSDYSMW